MLDWDAIASARVSYSIKRFMELPLRPQTNSSQRLYFVPRRGPRLAKRLAAVAVRLNARSARRPGSVFSADDGSEALEIVVAERAALVGPARIAPVSDEADVRDEKLEGGIRAHRLPRATPDRRH